MTIRKTVEIIAEGEINHNGDMATAMRMVDAAKACGVDRIKFQCFVAESFIAPGSEDMAIFKENQLSLADFKAIKAHADAIGLDMISTAADLLGLAMIVDLGLKVVKLGSTNINNIPLLEGVAETGLAVYLSTGAATLGEIEEAMRVLSRGTSDITLFHCTVQYPTEAPFVNLRALTTMMAAFPGIPIGFSDHTIGRTAAVAAVALGAQLLEKHFTLDNAMDGPDHSFSIDPADLTDYVKAVRDTEVMLGSPVKAPVGPEVGSRLNARRYLTAWGDVVAGTVLSPACVRSRRLDIATVDPSKLLVPAFEKTVSGWAAVRDLKDGEPITFDAIRPETAR